MSPSLPFIGHVHIFKTPRPPPTKKMTVKLRLNLNKLRSDTVWSLVLGSDVTSIAYDRALVVDNLQDNVLQRDDEGVVGASTAGQQGMTRYR